MAQVGNIIFQISADLKNIQGQLRTMEGNFNSSFGKIQSMANSFGKGILDGIIGGLSVGAVTQFGREILNLADSLQNLSEQTGVSVELLSGIKSPLEEAGTSIDAFAKGVFNLQKNLGNVDKDTDPAAQAIKRLGLNLKDLLNSSPDEFIRKVTDALGQIENPIERNTVMFNLLGKSAKELGPALAALAGRFDELRASGLSAADVKAIDDVGDALTRLKNQALVLGAEGVAGLLRFFGVLRDGATVATKLSSATDKFSQLSGLPRGRVEGMTSKDIIAAGEKPGFGINPQALRTARDEMLNLREEFERLNKVNVVKPQAAFRGISQGAKKAGTDVKSLTDNFLDGLEKQLASLETRKIELQFGDQAALGAKLDADLQRFKDGLRDKQLPIPKGLDDFFKVLRDRIVLASDELRKMELQLKRIDEVGRAMSQDSEEWLNVGEDLEKVRKEREPLIEQFDELRKQLAIGAIDQSTPEGKEKARVAGIVDEFEKTKAKLEELGLAAGKTQEEIAAGVADAWKKATQEIGNQTDEMTEFQRRAFERMHDAFSDLFKDALAGEVKSWEDAGNRIKKVIDDIVSEFLAMQLKIAVLGPDFGKQGGQLGGFAGLIGNLFGGIFGGGASGQFTGGATGYEAGFFHGGGEITPDLRHAQKRVALVMHGGGEVPIVAQSGEYMFNRWSARNIGKERLDFMNATGQVPGAPGVFNFTFNGVSDMDGFRKSRAQLSSELARAVAKGQKQL